MQQPNVIENKDTPKLPDPEKLMVLVGFGKRDLSELVAMVQAGQEDAAVKAAMNTPPRWRRMKICDPQDLDNMRVFTEFLNKKLGSRISGL